MCGLIGGVTIHKNGFLYSDLKILEDLLHINTLRGEDGTGLGLYCTDGNAQIIKEASVFYNFKKNSFYGDLTKKILSCGKVLIGHNRKATVGTIDDESSHPFFIEDRYIFCHNGTLNAQLMLEKLFKESNSKHKLQSKVDSEILGSLICPLSNDKEKFTALLNKISGAWACVWIDLQEEKLYFLRNRERSLFLARCTNGIFWSSEIEFLYTSFNRNKVKIEESIILEENVLYTIDLKEKVLDINKEELKTKEKIVFKIESQECNTSVSKNAFKKLQKEFVGKTIKFYIDDYIDKSPGLGDKYGWHVWGCNDELISLPHTIRAFLPAMLEKELIMNYVGRNIDAVITAAIRTDKGEVSFMVSLNELVH